MASGKEQEYEHIKEWLASRGHTDEEVVKIMKKLEQYESRMTRDSVFDSIGAEGFDLASFINEALEEDKGQAES